MNKPKTFDEVREFLSCIPSINGGGCGVAALAMYRWLKNHDELNDSFRFVACYDSDYDDDSQYINNMKVLRTKEGKAMATSHIAIMNSNNKVIDCNGNVSLSRYSLVQFIEAEWFITNMINNVDSWNNSFNRDNVKLIEKALDIELSEIKKV